MHAVDGMYQARSAPAPTAVTGPVLAATGLLVWIGLSIWGGLSSGEAGFRFHEAWDSPSYFLFGVPLMAAAVAIAAFHVPYRVWRWPVWLVAGHQIGVVLVGLGMQSGLSLILLTAILAVILTAFFSVPAVVGSMLARRLTVKRAF